jgi:hypothetical protein
VTTEHHFWQNEPNQKQNGFNDWLGTRDGVALVHHWSPPSAVSMKRRPLAEIDRLSLKAARSSKPSRQQGFGSLARMTEPRRSARVNFG